MFLSWLECTDNHPGKDPTTKEDLHLSKCAEEAQALAKCLERNQSYYEAPFQETQNVKEEEELRQAWERLIQEDLTTLPRQPFPQDHKPSLEFRPADRLGAILVDLQDIRQYSLLLVFVQDKDTNMLISAGSLDDLMVYQKRGILQCTLSESTQEVVVSALYENQDTGKDPIIYTYSAKVPKM